MRANDVNKVKKVKNVLRNVEASTTLNNDVQVNRGGGKEEKNIIKCLNMEDMNKVNNKLQQISEDLLGLTRN